MKKDLDQLGRLLREHLPVVGSNDEPNKLLNLACGRADETGVLADVFASEQGINITGMDIRDRELDHAREFWKGKLHDNAKAEFHVQNGTSLDQLSQLEDNFDVVFMRHQNYWNGDTTWKTIYDQALHRLDENGHLVITSYFDREHALALKAIQELGGKLITNVKNPDSRALNDAPGKSIDRHLAVFKIGK